MALLAATLGVACSDEVSNLIPALTSGNDKECEASARALGALGPRAGSAAPTMFEVVVKQRRAKGPTCWMVIADAMPKLGQDATSLLFTALTDHRAEDAAYVLAGMGASALPLLSKALADPKKVDGAVDAIGLIGPAAAPALGDLRTAHKQRRITERRFLAAISWFRTPETVPDLAAAIRSEDIEVRWMATRALADFAAESPAAVKALAVALQDPSPEIRNFAVIALSKAGPAASSAVPAVRYAADRRMISSGQARIAIQRMQPR